LKVVSDCEKKLAPMRDAAKADLETWERHLAGKRIDYGIPPFPGM
jgi:hypothetical protein